MATGYDKFPSAAWYAHNASEPYFNDEDIKKGFAMTDSMFRMVERELVKLLNAGAYLKYKHPAHLSISSLDKMQDAMEDRFPYLEHHRIPQEWKLAAFRRWARFNATAFQAGPPVARRRSQTARSIDSASPAKLSPPYKEATPNSPSVEDAPSKPRYRTFYECFLDITWVEDRRRYVTIPLKNLVAEGAANDNFDYKAIKFKHVQAAIQEGFAQEWERVGDSIPFVYSVDTHKLVYTPAKSKLKQVITTDKSLHTAIRMLRTHESGALKMDLLVSPKVLCRSSSSSNHFVDIFPRSPSFSIYDSFFLTLSAHVSSLSRPLKRKRIIDMMRVHDNEPNSLEEPPPYRRRRTL